MTCKHEEERVSNMSSIEQVEDKDRVINWLSQELRDARSSMKTMEERGEAAAFSYAEGRVDALFSLLRQLSESKESNK